MIEIGPKIIGISGVARSGKDTLGNLLIKRFKEAGYDARRFALADALKEDMRPFLIKELGIDPVTATGEDKDIIRPMLVAYGFAKRKQSKGLYWTNLLTQNIINSNCEIAVVTDIRYSEYEEDELQWLKGNGAPLIHVKRIMDYDKSNNPIFIKAPNIDEQTNDPKMERGADFKIVWETLEDDSKMDEYLDPVFEKLLNEEVPGL